MEVTRERMLNDMEISELKAQLTNQKQTTENSEVMLTRVVEEQNAAIAREEEAKSTHMHELTRMKAKLTKSKYTKNLYKKMAATVTAQRDVAWQRRINCSLRNLSWRTIWTPSVIWQCNTEILHLTCTISFIHLQGKGRWILMER